MSSIFLSHSHSDKAFARRLAYDLKAKGVRMWLDEAEMKVGQSLLLKITSSIESMDYVGAILSPNSIQSPWAKHELVMAMNSEISNSKVRVLPIYYQPCEIPLFLKDKLYVEFTNPDNYRRSLKILLDTLLGRPYGVYLTAKEAARIVSLKERPNAELWGLSQQGINRQYIPHLVMDSGDFYIADAKTGRSRMWVAEYYNRASKMLSAYGIVDGKVTEYPEMHSSGDDQKVINFNYIDADVADSAAIIRAKAEGAIPNDEGFFVNARMRYYTQMDFVWMVTFLDMTLSWATYVIYVNARNGVIIASKRAG
jgi:hypothetical protein